MVPPLVELWPVPFVLTDPSDNVEMPEACVDTESEDSRLRSVDSEGFLVGSAGGRDVLLRGGGCGAPFVRGGG